MLLGHNLTKRLNNTELVYPRNVYIKKLQSKQKKWRKSSANFQKNFNSTDIIGLKSGKSNKLFENGSNKCQQSGEKSTSMNSIESNIQNKQLQQIIKISNQITYQSSPNYLSIKLSQYNQDFYNYQLLKERVNNTAKLTNCNLHHQNQNLRHKFLHLFNLYAKQEILKHYCQKTGWKFQFQSQSYSKIMKNIVLPTLDILSVKRQDIKYMFEPFLSKITKRYLLHTEVDVYFGYASQHLLIQITQVWLKIKQAQIALKRQIRQQLNTFKIDFCKRNQGDVATNQKLEIDVKALYHFLFQDSKQIRMVSVIKLYIYLFKVHGESYDKSLQQWLEQY